jgi:hypothetical protein
MAESLVQRASILARASQIGVTLPLSRERRITLRPDGPESVAQLGLHSSAAAVVRRSQPYEGSTVDR